MFQYRRIPRFVFLSYFINYRSNDPFFCISGNEDDYIIISLVRSEKLGFLTDERRVNVMLTRCKTGMIICSSRTFLRGPAADTLVGKMFAKFGHSNLVEGSRVLQGEVEPF